MTSKVVIITKMHHIFQSNCFQISKGSPQWSSPHLLCKNLHQTTNSRQEKFPKFWKKFKFMLFTKIKNFNKAIENSHQKLKRFIIALSFVHFTPETIANLAILLLSLPTTVFSPSFCIAPNFVSCLSPYFYCFLQLCVLQQPPNWLLYLKHFSSCVLFWFVNLICARYLLLSPWLVGSSLSGYLVQVIAPVMGPLWFSFFNRFLYHAE